MALFDDIETIVRERRALTRAEAEALLAWPDLAGLGLLSEIARREVAGDRVTFGRVLSIAATTPEEIREALGEGSGVARAGEVRLTGTPATREDACAWVRAARGAADGRPVLGFSLADLWALAGPDPAALAALGGDLSDAGLAGVADLPLDAFATTTDAVNAVNGVRGGGLAVRRATVARARGADRLTMVERAVEVARQTAALVAFAPLPRADDADAPSTGYDDVRTIAIARLMCRSIPIIQVDWPLYGPKLAQVAIAFGANDIDGVAVVEAPGLGQRRSPREEIERQIRAAAGVPTERDGRYEWG